MTSDADKSGTVKKAKRKARLARELRDNLKRRKGQARERSPENRSDGAASRSARKTLIEPD